MVHSTRILDESVKGIEELNGCKDYIHANGQNEIDRVVVQSPVLIVGGGPTGLLQAHLLSSLGVRCLVVERYPERLGAPKAHALSPRSLEICRQFGLDTKRIRDMGTNRADAYWVNFVTNLSGKRVGVLPYERMDLEVLEATPEMIHNIPQPIFEQFLSEVLAKNPLVEIRKNVTFVSLEMENGLVTTVVEERTTGEQYNICSKHVIACDGARSKVRSFLGIESNGEDSYETMMTIHFHSDLRKVVGDRVGMLHWITDPEVSGFVIAYDLSDNQVLICNFDSTKHPVDSWSEELCRTIVTAAIGQDIPFTIHSYRPWILSRKVAQSYRMRNVFLAGDAAHSFPPTGGLGLNSGLADVHNLAYKIAALHQGWGRDSLLDTYQVDRQHVAEVNSQQSVKNGKRIFGLLKALGTTDSDIVKARQSLYRAIRDPNQMKLIAEEIERQREHFDNLELHIGYVYGTVAFPPHASRYTPKYVCGARLPHTWITIHSTSGLKELPPIDVSYVTEYGDNDVRMRKYSTLDLCAPDAFTFIGGSTDIWEESLRQVNSQFGKTLLRLNVACFDRDFGVIGTNGDAWVESFKLRTGGAVLVRPDQHILKLFTSESRSSELAECLAHYLGF